MRINKICFIVLFIGVVIVLLGINKAIEMPCVDVENPRLPIYSKVAKGLNDILKKMVLELLVIGKMMQI